MINKKRRTTVVSSPEQGDVEGNLRKLEKIDPGILAVATERVRYISSGLDNLRKFVGASTPSTEITKNIHILRGVAAPDPDSKPTEPALDVEAIAAMSVKGASTNGLIAVDPVQTEERAKELMTSDAHRLIDEAYEPGREITAELVSSRVPEQIIPDLPADTPQVIEARDMVEVARAAAERNQETVSADQAELMKFLASVREQQRAEAA